MRYAYRCSCGNEEIRIVPLEERNNQICVCGKRLQQDWSKKNILVDQTLGYYDPQLGKYIGSSSERRSEEQRAGVYALGKNESVFDVVKPKKRTPSRQLKEAVGNALNAVSNGYRVPKQATV